jgi:flagellin-specific chaperone FliS
MEDIEQKKIVSVSRGIKEAIATLDAEAIDEKLQELYDRVSKVLRASFGNEPFTIDKIPLVVTTITKAIQEFAYAQPQRLTGPEKQQMAVSFVKHVLKDFRDNGQIPEDTYQDILISVTVLGPTIVNLVVSAWKKTSEIIQDIDTNGCKGCVGRNCCVQ